MSSSSSSSKKDGSSGSGPQESNFSSQNSGYALTRLGDTIDPAQGKSFWIPTAGDLFTGLSVADKSISGDIFTSAGKPTTEKPIIFTSAGKPTIAGIAAAGKPHVFWLGSTGDLISLVRKPTSPDRHLIKYKSLHRFRHLRSGTIEDLISSVDENMPVVDWLKNHCGRGRRAIEDIAVIFSDKRKEYKVKDIVTAAHFDRLFQILDPRGYYEMKEQKKQDAFVARMTERGN